MKTCTPAGCTSPSVTAKRIRSDNVSYRSRRMALSSLWVSGLPIWAKRNAAPTARMTSAHQVVEVVGRFDVAAVSDAIL